MIIIGLLLAALTAVFASAAGFGEDDLGVLVAVVGGAVAQIVLMIGIIAKGVEIGNPASA